MNQDHQTAKKTNWEEIEKRIGASLSELSEAETSLLEKIFSAPANEPAATSNDKRTLSADKVQAILEKRARALAKVEQIDSGDAMQLVVFALADETYGIPTTYVREVQPLREISPVPCTPGFVVGVINIRGAIYSVIDIRSFFGVPDQAITNLTKVILVNTAELEVGILADDVLGETSVPQIEIKSPLATRSSIKEEYIHGVTSDMLSILNLQALLCDERIIVHEEVA